MRLCRMICTLHKSVTRTGGERSPAQSESLSQHVLDQLWSSSVARVNGAYAQRLMHSMTRIITNSQQRFIHNLTVTQ